jgi:hypothetical protein
MNYMVILLLNIFQEDNEILEHKMVYEKSDYDIISMHSWL